MNTVALRSFVASSVVAVWLSVAGTASAGLGDCAQPLSTGPSPLATDCLFILRVVVGLLTCPSDPCVCAPKGTLPASATDALLCLRVATGQPLPLSCPCGGNGCDQSQIPECGGTCGDEGRTCAPDPFDPGHCTCLNACEQSAAPACGVSCADIGFPDEQCLPVTRTPQGQPSTEACACLPADLVSCANAAAPACEGICQAGSTCEDTGGGCACTAQPVQGPCGGASPPACAGTCTDGFICETSGAGCACVAYVGQPASCFEAGAPVCGGTCASGDLCAVEVLGSCECLAPCEVSPAPACGGDCPSGGTCTAVTVSTSTVMLELCACEPAGN